MIYIIFLLYTPLSKGSRDALWVGGTLESPTANTATDRRRKPERLDNTDGNMSK